MQFQTVKIKPGKLLAQKCINYPSTIIDFIWTKISDVFSLYHILNAYTSLGPEVIGFANANGMCSGPKAYVQLVVENFQSDDYGENQHDVDISKSLY